MVQSILTGGFFSSFLCTPSCPPNRTVRETVIKPMTLCKYCSATTETSLYCYYYSHYKCKALYHTSYYEEILLQPKRGQYPPLIPYHLCHAWVLCFPMHPPTAITSYWTLIHSKASKPHASMEACILAAKQL